MTKIHYRKKHQTYPGSAIALTVITLGAITAISLGIAQIVPQDFRQSQNIQASLDAENAALSGVEHSLLLLQNAKKTNNYYELSQESMTTPGTYPYSAYIPSSGANDCEKFRDACPGINRQLGVPVAQTPYAVTAPLGRNDLSYGLTIWHRRENIGNKFDMFDRLTTPLLRDARNSANINPILERDEIRRLDVRDQSSFVLYWQPIGGPNCNLNGGTEFYLLYTFLDANNAVVPPRAVQKAINPSSYQALPLSVPTGAQTLSIRFMPTATVDATGSSDDSLISGCFAHYAIQNQSGEKSDLGFDVVESVGNSGPVSRKIRVMVPRESGNLLNVFDFGVACETCNNLD